MSFSEPTYAQVYKIKALLKSTGISFKTAKKFVFSTKKIDDLTSVEARDLINRLEKEPPK